MTRSSSDFWSADKLSLGSVARGVRRQQPLRRQDAGQEEALQSAALRAHQKGRTSSRLTFTSSGVSGAWFRGRVARSVSIFADKKPSTVGKLGRSSTAEPRTRTRIHRPPLHRRDTPLNRHAVLHCPTSAPPTSTRDQQHNAPGDRLCLRLSPPVLLVPCVRCDLTPAACVCAVLSYSQEVQQTRASTPARVWPRAAESLIWERSRHPTGPLAVTSTQRPFPPCDARTRLTRAKERSSRKRDLEKR